MLTRRRYSVLVILLLLPSVNQAQGSRSPAEPAARVDGLFARWTSPESPGCAVAVGQNGRTVLSRAYGMANLEYAVPNTPATVFGGGWVSRQFRAAAGLLLARRGKLSLDGPVRK